MAAAAAAMSSSPSLFRKKTMNGRSTHDFDFWKNLEIDIFKTRKTPKVTMWDTQKCAVHLHEVCLKKARNVMEHKTNTGSHERREEGTGRRGGTDIYESTAQTPLEAPAIVQKSGVVVPEAQAEVYSSDSLDWRKKSSSAKKEAAGAALISPFWSASQKDAQKMLEDEIEFFMIRIVRSIIVENKPLEVQEKIKDISHRRALTRVSILMSVLIALHEEGYHLSERMVMFMWREMKVANFVQGSNIVRLLDPGAFSWESVVKILEWWVLLQDRCYLNCPDEAKFDNLRITQDIVSQICKDVILPGETSIPHILDEQYIFEKKEYHTYGANVSIFIAIASRTIPLEDCNEFCIKVLRPIVHQLQLLRDKTATMDNGVVKRSFEVALFSAYATCAYLCYNWGKVEEGNTYAQLGLIDNPGIYNKDAVAIKLAYMHRFYSQKALRAKARISRYEPDDVVMCLRAGGNRKNMIGEMLVGLLARFRGNLIEMFSLLWDRLSLSIPNINTCLPLEEIVRAISSFMKQKREIVCKSIKKINPEEDIFIASYVDIQKKKRLSKKEKPSNAQAAYSWFEHQVAPFIRSKRFISIYGDAPFASLYKECFKMFHEAYPGEFYLKKMMSQKIFDAIVFKLEGKIGQKMTNIALRSQIKKNMSGVKEVHLNASTRLSDYDKDAFKDVKLFFVEYH